MTNVFRDQEPDIVDNARLRVPQREAFLALSREHGVDSDDREVGIVLPVGCGKSGVITLTPFAFRSERVLVVAPNLNICDQLFGSFDPASEGYFYGKCNVLDSSVFPEPAEIRGRESNLGDLQHADVVVTNIQQLQGDSNRWLDALPGDFFDLVVFDEAHHNVADSWTGLREKFPAAQIVNLSATPMRADGQRMAGRIIYSYPVADAIREGYVKRLKAVALNPTTLKFVRSENREEEIPLDEVRRLGEEDAEFRRSIVTSDETLATILDAAIGQLRRLRQESGDNRHKMICSALNYDHCIQIKEALVARGLAAEYVHSREASAANQRILERLENHELDAIIQVRKLGEGFDHPYLSVAAVCSIFSNLSPFVQYVGRIMRVVEHNRKRPADPVLPQVVPS